MKTHPLKRLLPLLLSFTLLAPASACAPQTALTHTDAETDVMQTETGAASETAGAASETTETASETAEAAVSEASAPTDEPTASQTLLLAAAASLEPCMTEALLPLFEETHPGITVEGTYDSSGKLQAQIEAGLEADLFFSAATAQMDALEEEGLVVSDTITPLLMNELVLIVPAGSEAGFETFTDIARAEMIAIGDPASVPAGQYAKEALTSLGLWDSLSSRASLGTNVTEVLNWVAAQSADAGLVYRTDAMTTDQVTVIAAAPEGSLQTPVLYPAALVSSSTHTEAAEALLDFFQSEEAAAIFQSYGFTPQP